MHSLFGAAATASIWFATAGVCLAGALMPPSAITTDAKNYLTLTQLRAKYEKPDGKYLKFHGIDIYYTDEGKGPPILMVHGSSSTLMTYDRLAASLKDRYRVIRYDIPPQGLSGPVSDEAAKQLKQTDIPQALLDHLGVKDATVIGVSSGGTMAYFLAADRPDLVSRLVISNAPGDVVDTSPMQLSKALAAEQSKLGEAITGTYKTREFWDAFWDFFTGEPERASKALRDQFYDINRRVPEPNRFSVTALTRDHAYTVAQAAKVTQPVLLLWGERDPLLPVSTAKTLADKYLVNADVSLVVMPDVGHYPPIEVPERYGKIVDAYITAATPLKPIAPDPKDR